MIRYLILTSLVLSLLQKNSQDTFVGLSASIPSLIIDTFSGSISGWLYFLFCGVVACIIIHYIHEIKTRLSKTITMLLFISILINFLGFNLWFFYFEPTLYYNLFVLYYISISVTLSTQGSLTCLSSCNGWQRALASLRCWFVRIQR